MAEVMSAVAGGGLHPTTPHEYPLVEAANALADLQSRRATGKVVLIP
jgi:NADPH:quinone reductase-like Zn-dependent oxidoreductase